VDFVLTLEGIAQELVQISRHPYVAPPAAAASAVGRQRWLSKILTLLRKAKGVEFTDYKGNTVHRRIALRMVLIKLASMEDYARFLRENAVEICIFSSRC
jgi:two-component system, chemotaxis family, CheB/CheR fusion protein